MKRFTGKILFPAATALIYLLGLSVGIYVMCHFSMMAQRGYLIDKSRAVADAVQLPEELPRDVYQDNGRVLIYDADGLLKGNYYAPRSNAPTEAYISCESFLDSVLDGHDLTRVVLRFGQSEYLIDIYFITGVPIIRDGGITGAVFLTLRQTFFPRTIMIFASYFTVFYAVTAAVVLVTLKKRKDFEIMRKRYLMNMTHALKTPVTSIKALAETLCDGVEPDPQAQAQLCQIILQQADLQSDMVNKMLSLSRIQSKIMDFRKQRTAPYEIFDGLVEKHLPLCEHRGLSLRITDGVRSLPMLYTNAAAARQILDAVLENAIKFSPEGGVIVLDASVSKKRAVISVKDQGPGISREALPHVFDRFYSDACANRSEGSGLGLSIAKELTQGLREKIWIKSAPDTGTEVFLSLRIAR